MAGTPIGSFPPVGFLDETGLTSAAHATAKAPVGAVWTVWDPTTNNWSLISYYQVGATVVRGDALMHDSSQYKFYRLVAATTGNAAEIPRGFAAASVNNTGYYSYRYIGGYCPSIKFLSNVGSNQVTGLAGSIAAAMSAYPANNTIAAVGATSATMSYACVYSLDVNAATAVNSGIIQAFML